MGKWGNNEDMFTFTAIPFPDIDPIIFSVGPFAIRWYALAYVFGLLIGWRYLRVFNNWAPAGLTGETRLLAFTSRAGAEGAEDVKRNVDDFLVWATIGVVLGGRIGYVLFYNFPYYAAHPLAILRVWQGGMSFHGGLAGMVVAVIIFARVRKIPFLAMADAVSAAAPIGLFLGRLANFVNGELWGRTTDVPWAVIFPNGGPAPRHPSQIYEALLEGVVLFLVLYFLSRIEAVRRRPGMLTGVFFIGYALARGFVEFFRQPDVQIGFLPGGTTMGQWLSVPVLLVGVAFLVLAKPQR
jgi:phosphatidylglycerol:prolipoprotein diacylglycerol transferase